MAAQPLAGGQQIFNCYGELSNTELVLKYGFALRDNPFSMVELDKGVILRAAQQLHGAKAFAKRRRFLLDHRSVPISSPNAPHCMKAAVQTRVTFKYGFKYNWQAV